MVLRDLPVWRLDGELRVRDEDLARRLGCKDLSDIRELIQRNAEERTRWR